MANSSSPPSIGKLPRRSSSSEVQSPLSQLLIDVKVLRKKVKSKDGLGGPDYDAFSNAVCRLYEWLDTHSIGDIEKAVKR